MNVQQEHKALRRLCRWFRRQQRERGLISTHISTSFVSGITLNDKTVAILEGVARGDYPLAAVFSPEQLANFETSVQGIYRCMLISDLIDYGIIQTLPPPEPSGEAHPKILALLRGEDIGPVARPDVF